MEKSFKLVESPTLVYDVFRNAKKLGGACLLLDGTNEKSPRKINLFSIPLIETTENKRYSMQISYVPEGEENQAFIAYDFQEFSNGNYRDVSYSTVGIKFPERFLSRFLNLANLKTGALGNIKKNGIADDAPKTPEGLKFGFYKAILTGEDFEFHHKGNDDTRKWKYAVTDEEEKQYLEAFAKLFRQSPDTKDFNSEYGHFFRRQLASESRERGTQQPYTESNDTPSF